jgi:hypothetical protein
MNAPQPLTFSALDGLAFAAERGRLPQQPTDLALCADALGPFLELTLLSRNGLLPPPDKATWLSLGETASLEGALRSGKAQWVCPTTRAAGFYRAPATWNDEDIQWIGFGLAAQKAAIAEGFQSQIAAQFVGALGEMISNIYEHSGAPGSGIAVFRAGGGAFEFAISDSGVGVLDSLRTCPHYAGLTDCGAALRLALTDGVSRFGPEAKRGNGFRPIFVGLANLRGSLRFRSGNHALIIDGDRIERMQAKTAQKVGLQGFFASVSCKPASKRSERAPDITTAP